MLACDHPEGTYQDQLDHMRGLMVRHGWAVQGGEGDRIHPPLAYTLGLTHCGLPELVVSGPLIEIVELAHPDAHLDTAVALFGRELRALQLVWADDRGHWPWERGFRGMRGGQPVLGLCSE